MVKFDIHRYNSEPMSFENSYMESTRLVSRKNHAIAIDALSTDTGINSNFTAIKFYHK